MKSVIRIHPRPVLWALLAVNAVLVCGFLVTRHVTIPSRAINRFFDLSAEASIPAWYNAALLLVAGLLALLRALHLRAGGPGSHWKVYLVGAAALLFLSADEVAQIHETLSGTMHRRFAGTTGAMADVEMWDLVTFALYAAAGLALFALLRRDALALLRESRGRWPFLVGGITFVLGAVFVDQLHIGLPGPVRVAIEDGMEMTGSALMLYGLLRKLGTVTLSVPAAVVTAPARQTRAFPAAAFEDEMLDLRHP